MKTNRDVESNFNIHDIFKLTEHVDWGESRLVMSPSSFTKDDFLRINVCGRYYDVLRSMLDQHPTTMLGDERRRRAHFVDHMNAVYLNQDTRLFESVLFYYQTGILIRPPAIPMCLFVKCLQMFRFFDFNHFQFFESIFTPFFIYS